MKTNAPEQTDPVALLAALDAEALERRLADLDAERKAVSLILRSIRARERAKRRAARQTVHATEEGRRNE
jgi:hypothetical protein